MTHLLLALAVLACAATGRFEPVKVLRAHGLEPAKLTLAAEIAPRSVRVSGDYAGTPIAGVRAWNDGTFGPEGLRIDAEPLPEALKGKGLGTTLYLIAARLARDQRATVMSADGYRSADADRVWDGLVASGAAERRGIVESVTADDAKLRRATEPSLALLNAFDPEKVLKAHGVDPDKLAIEEEASPLHLRLELRQAGEKAGVINATRGMGGFWNVLLVRVEPPFQGKGLGSLLYLAAARLLSDRHDGRLASILARSHHADAVWSRLKDAGLAERAVDGEGDPVDAVTADRGVLEAATEKTLAFVQARLAKPLRRN